MYYRTDDVNILQKYPVVSSIIIASVTQCTQVPTLTSVDEQIFDGDLLHYQMALSAQAPKFFPHKPMKQILIP